MSIPGAGDRIGAGGNAGSGAGTTTAGASSRASADATHAQQPNAMAVAFTVNGQKRRIELDTRVTLLDALREYLHLTGTKKGCDHGHCGACTVIVNGVRINACLSLAAMHEGDAITTIEGIGRPGHLHPMQAAFIAHDAFQCGYCTPGQICSAVVVLDEIRAGVPSHLTSDLTGPMTLSNAELRERMSGNICRCGAYSNIADAVAAVAGHAP